MACSDAYSQPLEDAEGIICGDTLEICKPRDDGELITMFYERYFLRSCDKPPRDLLFIDIRRKICPEGEVVLCWQTSFDFIAEEHPHISQILALAVAKDFSRREREPMIERAWAHIEVIRGIALQYFQSHELDARGRFSPSLYNYYKSLSDDIELHLDKYVHLNEPYTHHTNTLAWQVISTEICRKFIKWLQQDQVFEIDKVYFESELTNKALRESYTTCYEKENRFYSISYDFPKLHWVETLFILRNNTVPFFFFVECPLRNLLIP